MILGQVGVKMVLVDRDDHKIHLGRRNYVEKNYRINSIIEILRLSYFSLNNCKYVLLFWEVKLMDR
jgi:hypothetical protein